MNREYSMEEENNVNTSSEEISEDDLIDDKKDNSGSDQQDSEEKQSDDAILLELTDRQEQAMEQLFAVFGLLKMDPIHDKYVSDPVSLDKMLLFTRLRTNPIRSRVDEVYRYLRELCDVLEGKLVQVNDPNPYDLLVQESNDLLTGLKKLFNESNNTEQVRLLTIAPKEWGREKIRKW